MKINIRIRLLFSLLLSFSLFACSDDDGELTPSFLDEDYFVVQNNPDGDELDQLRYKIYNEAGITFFYNDTLMVQTRYDNAGEPYPYYKVYNMGYSFVSYSTDNYILSYDRQLLKDFTECYYEKIYPVLKPSDIPLKGFLIVDTLRTSAKKLLDLYLDASNTMMVLGMHNAKGVLFKDLTTEERAEYMKSLLYTQVYQYFGGTDGLGGNKREDFKGFFQISKNARPEWPDLKDPSTTKFPYGNSFYPYDPKRDTLSDGSKFLCPDPREIGFLKFRYQTTGLGGHDACPMVPDDYNMYLNLVYTKTDAEIREEYKDWKVVIEKYEFMVAFLKKHGLDLFLKTENE